MPKTAKTKPAGKYQLVPIARLVLNDQLQPREQMSEEHVENIADAVRRRVKLPRVKVFDVAGTLFVWDGFHTVKGHLKAGRAMVACSVRAGTWEDAVLAACGANAEHTALPRTNADKGRAVQLLLASFPNKTNGWIAAAAKVSDETVRRYRGEQVPQCGTSDTREGLDGKEYPAHRTDDQKAANAARRVPLRKRLTLADRVWEKLERHGMGTVGQLVDQLQLGNEFGLAEGDLRDLVHEMADDQKYARTAAPAVMANVPAPGTAKFDWRPFDAALGTVVRGVDALVAAHPEYKGSLRHKQVDALLDRLCRLMNDWQADHAKPKE